MTEIEKAIKCLEDYLDDETGFYVLEGDAINEAIQALHEKAEREAEPRALTLEELRERANKPYWHVSIQQSSMFQSMEPHWVILPEHVAARPEDYHYGERWLAYDREPKEKTK